VFSHERRGDLKVAATGSRRGTPSIGKRCYTARLMLEPGQPAPTVTFGRGDGSDVALADLYGEGTVVLAFLRHFG